MTTSQRRRRRSIRIASAITGLIFITVTLVGPAIGDLIAP